MKLVCDSNDVPSAKKLKDDRFDWPRELGAVELQPDDIGFTFSYEHGPEHLEKQVGRVPSIHDRPDERSELVNLNDVLGKLSEAGIEVPTPKTWVIGVDEDILADLAFPLFVRTPKLSWKRGGKQGQARNQGTQRRSGLLRRAFGWDTPIIAHEWLDIAPAGKRMFGDAPQEIRTGVIDGTPVAWSFRYLHAIPSPAGFPPSADGLGRRRVWTPTFDADDASVGVPNAWLR